MSFPYISTRIGGLYSRFPGEEEISALFKESSIAMITTLFEKSLFRSPLEQWRERKKGELSLEEALRIIEGGFTHTARWTTRLFEEFLPSLAPLLLSRWELEQLKEMVRILPLKGPYEERRLPFLSFHRCRRSWTKRWREYKKIEELAQALREENHPFVRGFEKGRKVDEMSLERFYFQEYLPPWRSKVRKSWFYFQDQCDRINLHNLILLRREEDEEIDPRKLFLQGPGKISIRTFIRLLEADEEEVLPWIEGKFGTSPLGRPSLSDPRFPSALEGIFLRRWRRAALIDPGGVWGALLFTEELRIMIADLKLALLFRITGKGEEAHRAYWVGKKRER